MSLGVVRRTGTDVFSAADVGVSPPRRCLETSFNASPVGL